MTFTVDRISASILPGLSAAPTPGSVHSVFRRTVNILLNDMTWLSLHPCGVPMHPYAVTVRLKSDNLENSPPWKTDGSCGAVEKVGYLRLVKNIQMRGLRRLHERGVLERTPQGRESSITKQMGVFQQPGCPAPGCVPKPGWGDRKSGAAKFLDVENGNPVTVSRSAIRLGGQPLEIDLRGAEAWEPGLEPLKAETGAGYAPMLDTLKAILGQTPVVSPFLAAVLDRPVGAADTWSCAVRAEAASIIRCVETGLRERSRDALLDGIGRAIGLGSGFTPSGDDFLTGLLGTYLYFAPGDELREHLFRMMTPLIHRTSLPSFFMLKAALEGHFPEHLTDLIASLGCGSTAGLIGSLRLIIATGATSGEDMLAGLIMYMRVSAEIGYAYATH